MRTGIAKRRDVPTPDPLADFESEVKIVYTDPIPLPAAWPTTHAPTHPIDTTSRVISFVLGFALASLIAWLGSISGDRVAATSDGEAVASVGTPVDAVATQERQPVINTEPKATAPALVASSSPASAPRAPAARTISTAPAPRQAASKTAESAPVSASASRASRPPASGYRGALALSSSPEGAQVVLNGKLVGQTPVVLHDLPVGSRALIVRREGYSPWSASVRVVAGQRTTVRATLRPNPQSGG
jgi:hypothetical protein